MRCEGSEMSPSSSSLSILLALEESFGLSVMEGSNSKKKMGILNFNLEEGRFK